MVEIYLAIVLTPTSTASKNIGMKMVNVLQTTNHFVQAGPNRKHYQVRTYVLASEAGVALHTPEKVFKGIGSYNARDTPRVDHAEQPAHRRSRCGG